MKNAKLLYVVAAGCYAVDFLLPIFLDLFMVFDDNLVKSMCFTFYSMFYFYGRVSENVDSPMISVLSALIMGILIILMIISAVFIIVKNKNCFLLPSFILLCTTAMHIYLIFTDGLLPAYAWIGFLFKILCLGVYVFAHLKMQNKQMRS